MAKGKGASYELAMLLTLKNQASRGLSTFVRQLRTANREAKSFNRTLDSINTRLNRTSSNAGLESRIAQLRTYRRELRTLARDNDRARNSIGRGLGRGLERPPRPRTREEELEHIENLAGGRGRRGQPRRLGFFDRMERADMAVQSARQVGYAWREGADMLRQFTDESQRLGRAEMRFRLIGLSANENARAFEAVRRTVRDVSGVNLTDATENMTDLVGALGNVDQAIRALPLASRYRMNFEVLFGGEMGQEALNEQVLSAFRLLELTGNTQRGEQQMTRMLDTITRITAATGGRVSPSELLTMARRGNPAVSGLSERGLLAISSLIEDMGAPQVGTSLMTLYGNLVQGRMRQDAAAGFHRLGLLDPSRIEFGRAQRIRRLRPGANLLGPLLQEDPLAAADLLTERLRQTGVDVTDDRAVHAQLGVLFPDRNAFRMMNMLITQREQVTKEMQRAEQSMGLSQMSSMLQDSDLQRIREFETAWRNLKTTIGLPLLQSGTQILQYLQPLFELAAQRPRIVMALLAIRGGFLPLLETAAAFGRLRPSRVLSDIERSAGGAAGALGRAGREADALHGRMGRLAGLKPILLTAQFMVAGIAIDQIIQWWNEVQDRDRRQRESNQGLGRTYDEMIGRGQLFGGPTPTSPEQLDTVAQSILDTFNTDRRLELALQPERAGLFEHFWTAQRPYASRRHPQIWDNFQRPFNPDIAAQRWRSQEGSRLLHDPQVLSRLLLRVDRGAMNLDAESIRLFKQAIERTVGSETYQRAVQLANQEMLNLGAQSQQAGQAFSLMLPPAERLPPAFSRLGEAATTLSLRLNNLTLPPDSSIFGPPLPGRGRLGGSSIFDPPDRPRPRFSLPPVELPSRATGGIVRRTGFAEVHEREAILPAVITERLRDADMPVTRALAAPSPEMASPRALALPASGATHFSLSYGDINVNVNVPPGSAAASNPQELRAMFRQEAEEVFRLGMRKDLERYFDQMREDRASRRG